MLLAGSSTEDSVVAVTHFGLSQTLVVSKLFSFEPSDTDL